MKPDIHNSDYCCSMCSSGRKERQFALSQTSNNRFVLWEAEELFAVNQWYENSSRKSGNHPEYPIVSPPNDEYVLSYGAILPNPLHDVDLQNEIFQHKNNSMITLLDDCLYESAYRDIWLSEERVHTKNIPCAAMLNTALKLNIERDYDFGYGMFLKYSDLKLFDNMVNRPFILCVKGVEKRFDKYSDDWTSNIDKEKCLKIANEIF